MMPFQSYQLWQIERPKTPAEHYAADLQRGLFAAAVSRSVRHTARRTVEVTGRSRLLLARAARLGAATPAARVPGWLRAGVQLRELRSSHAPPDTTSVSVPRTRTAESSSRA